MNLFTEPQPSAKQPLADTAPTRKFLFERSFDAAAAARAPERKPVTLRPEQYDALKQEAYDLGFAAGREAGGNEQTEKLMATLSQVGDRIEQMLGHMQALHKESENGMRRMVLAIARKFLPDLTSRHGLREIEALLESVMGEMVHEPRLVVRVNESQFDALDAKIGTLATQKAYAGKVVILVDSEIAPGDCRVEWADGGMERKAETTWNKVEQVVAPENGLMQN